MWEFFHENFVDHRPIMLVKMRQNIKYNIHVFVILPLFQEIRQSTRGGGGTG